MQYKAVWGCSLFVLLWFFNYQALSSWFSNFVQALRKGSSLFRTISQTIGILTPKYSWAKIFRKAMILDHSISPDRAFNSSERLREASPMTSRLRTTASCLCVRSKGLFIHPLDVFAYSIDRFQDVIQVESIVPTHKRLLSE